MEKTCYIKKINSYYYLYDKDSERFIGSNTKNAPPSSYLPEYVIEAYEQGVREFKLQFEAKEEWYPVYDKQGLLKITYETPKKQTFTREEVIKILKKVSEYNKYNEDINPGYFIDNFDKYQ